MVFGKDQKKKKTKKGVTNNSQRSKKQRREARNDPRRAAQTMGSNASKDASAGAVDDASLLKNSNDGEHAVPRRMRDVNEELEEEGLEKLTEIEIRAAIKVAYLVEFRRPPEEEWSDKDGGIVGVLRYRLGVDPRTVKSVLTNIENGGSIERKKGSGRKLKLEKDNAGLRCAAIAMNGGMGPGPATDLCNLINREDNMHMSEEEFKKKHDVFATISGQNR